MPRHEPLGQHDSTATWAVAALLVTLAVLATTAAAVVWRPVGPKPDKLNIELKIINRQITVQ